MPELESVTKQEVREALIRLGASILGLKQGWSGADLTRLIDLDVGVLFRFLQPYLAEPEPAPEQPPPAPSPPQTPAEVTDEPFTVPVMALDDELGVVVTKKKVK